MSDSDDDGPVLSKEALAALSEFYQEEKERTQVDRTKNFYQQFKEDWQLSQFWYDEETVDKLSKEIQTAVGEEGKIALISCPTLFPEVKKKCANCEVKLFEFDKRFGLIGDDFVYYDYKNPLDIPQAFAKYFDIVVADPPFLSEECFTKTAVSMRFLSKSKVIISTGAVMENLARRLLGVKKTSFNPRHKNNLSNEFCCYTNYDDHLSDKTNES